MSDALLPPGVRALLQDVFPAAVIADPTPTSGGYSHRSAFVQIGDHALAAKIADAPARRADLRREARMLALLHPHRLPVPELVHLLEDETWTTLLIRRVPGMPGQVLYEWPPEALAPVYGALGALLAQIHAIRPPASPDADLDLVARRRLISGGLAGMALPADLLAPLRAALDATQSLTAVPCLTHGDPGLHNVVANGDQVTLIDWEWAGWDHPLRDFAWLAWTMQFRLMPIMLWDAFLQGYTLGGIAGPARHVETLHNYALAQIAAILQRCPPGSPVQAEWIRRARWTLELDFGPYAAWPLPQVAQRVR